MKIVVAEKISVAAIDSLREPDWQIVTPETMDGGLALQLESADALIVRSAVQVDDGLLANAHKLRVIGRAGVGVDNIDLEPATRRGIAVMNTPGANAVAAQKQVKAYMENAKKTFPAGIDYALPYDSTMSCAPRFPTSL